MSNSSKTSQIADNIISGVVSVVLLIMSQVVILALWGLMDIWRPTAMVISIAAAAIFLAVYWLSVYNLSRKEILHQALPKIMYGVALVFAVPILLYVSTNGQGIIQADLTVWITQVAIILALYLVKRYGNEHAADFLLDEDDTNEYRGAKERINFFDKGC